MFTLLKVPPVVRRSRTLLLRLLWNPPEQFVPWHVIQILWAPVQPMTRACRIVTLVTCPLVVPTRVESLPRRVAVVVVPLLKIVHLSRPPLDRQPTARVTRPRPKIPVYCVQLVFPLVRNPVRTLISRPIPGGLVRAIAPPCGARVPPFKRIVCKLLNLHFLFRSLTWVVPL